ncbi:hypothetical protein AB0I98_35320 [Streptomyces sp. NPDC050211]|uniref:hypothetical protein n=1 Tax=Streptomyces sp. NPDC050211 TaxID=3154932 RepID=UPI0034446A7B
MKRIRWFITGYERNGRFEASDTATPSDDAERRKQFDDLLYSALTGLVHRVGGTVRA